jgi:hypothetical protein
MVQALSRYRRRLKVRDVVACGRAGDKEGKEKRARADLSATRAQDRPSPTAELVSGSRGRESIALMLAFAFRFLGRGRLGWRRRGRPKSATL